MAALPRARIGQSCALDARDAVREFHDAVVQPDMALVVFFASIEFDRDAIAEQMQTAFAGVPVIGCTTAGEFGPAGYRDRSLSGASLPCGSFAAATGRIADLDRFDFEQAQTLVEHMWHDLHRQDPSASAETSFAFLLIDGLSVREEPVAAALQEALREVPLVGGSAGDGLAFGQTQVYLDGAFSSRSAVLALVSTRLPFRVFKTQHFVPIQDRAVVTSADAKHRLIRQIDGRPAAQGYARLVGVAEASLDPMRFAAQPVVVLIDGTSYVRSIQKVNPDGSLTLFCAIEEGIVLRAALGVDLVRNLDEQLSKIKAEIGAPQLVLGCDCVLRKLEIINAGLVGQVEDLFAANNGVGFNSYGEQFRGVHVNQTLTGIAIGAAPFDGDGDGDGGGDGGDRDGAP